MLLSLLKSRATVTWLLLVVAAVVAPVLSVESGHGTAAVVVVLAIAAVKVRLVGLDFMELRHAPWALRAAFEAYCVALWAVLSGLYVWL